MCWGEGEGEDAQLARRPASGSGHKNKVVSLPHSNDTSAVMKTADYVSPFPESVVQEDIVPKRLASLCVNLRAAVRNFGIWWRAAIAIQVRPTLLILLCWPCAGLVLALCWPCACLASFAPRPFALHSVHPHLGCGYAWV